MRKRFGLGLGGVKADVLGAIEHDRMADDRSGSVGPMAQNGFGLAGGLLGGLKATDSHGGSRNEDINQEQPREMKLEDMVEEEL